MAELLCRNSCLLLVAHYFRSKVPSYSTHPLIQIHLNLNFCYFEHIFKSLEFALCFMLLNSNSDNLNFSLIQMFFSVLWPKNALANSNFRTFIVTYGKKNEDKYLNFTLIVVKYLSVYWQILLVQKNEVCRESVVLFHCLNLLFFLLLQPDSSFHCLHVENTKRFWRNVQTFL